MDIRGLEALFRGGLFFVFVFLNLETEGLCRNFHFRWIFAEALANQPTVGVIPSTRLFPCLEVPCPCHISRCNAETALLHILTLASFAAQSSPN